MTNRTYLTLLLLLAGNCLAGDVRVVSGRSVDLQPVHDWFANHQGERPMKHWKQVQVQEWKGDIAWPHVVIMLEDGTQQEVLLKNCDAFVLNPIKELVALDQQIAEADAGVMTTGATGNNTVTRRMAAQANANSDANKALAEQLRKNRAAVNQRAKAAKDVKLLAMFTGAKYGGYDVWDCGSRN